MYGHLRIHVYILLPIFSPQKCQEINDYRFYDSSTWFYIILFVHISVKFVLSGRFSYILIIFDVRKKKLRKAYTYKRIHAARDVHSL